VDKQLFEELLDSVRWTGRAIRGEPVEGGRVSEVKSLSSDEIRQVREMTGLSQERFARLILVSKGTLVNWEQGRRMPSGPARALLTALKNDPVHVVKAVRGDKHAA
jgi:putative transcriptional regulator